MSIEFDCSVKSANADFAEDPTGALVIMLKNMIRKIEGGYEHGLLKDANGNTVGRFHLEAVVEDSTDEE